MIQLSLVKLIHVYPLHRIRETGLSKSTQNQQQTKQHISGIFQSMTLILDNII